MPRFRFTVRRAFAAVAVVSLWLALAAYAIRIDAEARQRMHCLSNLSQVSKAVLSYALTQGAFPPGAKPVAGLAPEGRMSWMTPLPPYIDGPGGQPYVQDAAGNRVPVYTGKMAIFLCPGNPDQLSPSGDGLTHFVGIAGLGIDAPVLPSGHPRAGIFGYDRATRLAEIKDGASQTMLLAETSQANGPWIRGGPSTVRGLDPARQPYIGRNRQFGGTHRGGATVAFADGSARFVSDSIDPRIFEATSTIAGGEVLPVGWDR
jgi:prepilin-type processing-associated H-X9-DG protein